MVKNLIDLPLPAHSQVANCAFFMDFRANLALPQSHGDLCVFHGVRARCALIETSKLNDVDPLAYLTDVQSRCGIDPVV